MIRLIATCEPARLGWLHQFVAHYRHQGVQYFQLSLHLEPGTPATEVASARARAASIAEEVNLPPFREIHEPFDAMALRRHHDHIQNSECATEDWLVWADIDEFHIFGGNLAELTEGWDRAGCNAAGGVFIDRVAREGLLPSFNPMRTIWSQYPLGCNLTAKVVRGMTKKVVIARANVRMRHANHNPLRHQRMSWAMMDVPIHHFKWDSGVLARLSQRIDNDWKVRCAWWTQSENILNAITARSGRLPLDLVDTLDFEDDLLPESHTPYESNSRYGRSPFGRYEP